MAAEKDSNSYRSILKGISLFGGVKVFEILINLIRGKFVAIFLGPGGVGISSIFANVSATVSQLSSCGLNLAIVKEVVSAKEEPERLYQVIGVSRRLTLATAIFGAVLCILLAPLLADFSFGSRQLTSQFLYIALAVFFIVDNGGKLAVLQGLQEVKRLSRSTLIGALAGLIVGVPLYWKFGNAAIAPAIAGLTFCQNLFYTTQLHGACRHLPRASIRISSHTPLIRKLFALGIILLASDMIGNICNYLLLAVIRKMGGIDDVGFFQSANSITNQVAGVVFTAMSLDYFPRLSAVASDNREMNAVVDRQANVICHIILPLALLLILFAPLVVRILLTAKFEVIVPLLRWMALGVVIKALAYPMGYITFAKDNKSVFFWLEGITANILFLIAPIIFFHWFGLTGFGYGMVAEQSLCFIIYYLVNRRLYGYRPSSETVRNFAITVCATGMTLLASFIPNDITAYSIMGVMTAATIIYCTLRLKRNIRK